MNLWQILLLRLFGVKPKKKWPLRPHRNTHTVMPHARPNFNELFQYIYQQTTP
jgi:hypothetical protein